MGRGEHQAQGTRQVGYRARNALSRAKHPSMVRVRFLMSTMVEHELSMTIVHAIQILLKIQQQRSPLSYSNTDNHLMGAVLGIDAWGGYMYAEFGGVSCLSSQWKRSLTAVLPCSHECSYIRELFPTSPCLSQICHTDESHGTRNLLPHY